MEVDHPSNFAFLESMKVIKMGASIDTYRNDPPKGGLVFHIKSMVRTDFSMMLEEPNPFYNRKIMSHTNSNQ